MASILKASRHVAMWSVGAGTAIPLILPSVLAEDKPVSGPCCQGKIKPSQLPIYDEPEDLYDITYYVSGKGQLQEGVEAVRKELEEALDSTKERRDQVDHIYQTGKAHTAGQIAYLRDEENLPARVGAITAGGLVGLLFGARGRILKKLLYTSVGAGATGAVLYPEYCKLYSQDLWHNANTYATVAYNFFVGVKPQVNGSGSGSQETAAISPVDSGKSKSLDAIGVESDDKNRGDSTDKKAPQVAEKVKDVVVRAEADKKKGAGETKLEVDHGQSNPEDADMYTTRS